MADDTIEQEDDDSPYRNILRSTSLIGASSVVSMILSVVRLKVLAVLLGPAGVGLFGLYFVVVDLCANLAGFGIQSSGVRQVAVATASGDLVKVAKIAKVLRVASLVLGIIGALLVVALAAPISTITFGTDVRASAVMLIGGAVLLRILAGAPIAIIQGNRRIGDLARMTIAGALLNTLAAIPLVYFFGEAGIVPSLLALGLTTWVAALWYCRKIQLPKVKLTLPEFTAETGALLKLGFAFMASGFLTAGAAFVIRILIVQQHGVDAAGNYQAAWALAGIYIGFILQAMGTDFYPRLSAISDDNKACNRTVNEQARVSILLAGPGLLGTLALAPLVMSIFYTAQFADAVPLLRWFCLGMLLRVVSWPMGFIILAKGAQTMFFWTEVAASTVHVGLAWLLLGTFGLAGAGVAFVGLYIWHSLLIYLLVRRMSGFRWSKENFALGSLFLGLTIIVLIAVEMAPYWLGLAIAMAGTILACWISSSQLIGLVPQKWIPESLRPLIYFLLRHQPKLAPGRA
ncbi:O-antigen translocase [Devosia algicola]|uniref:O-antigen translocase n=1 Tax=Devosia algicola TaxID=3026418 RepID=A0ABY7YP12_9HYPH|nr:O-antigen translocase [Devosia algicola]WDR02922.1 O-antigen translocase [Devosia algicola]